jgi:hypothetical protein
MIAANSVSSGVSCVPPPWGRTFDGENGEREYASGMEANAVK